MAHNSGELPQENPVGSGKFFWSDGTQATPAEVQEILDQASGKAPSDTPEGKQIDTTVRGEGPLDFLIPSQIAGNAPGASLDTAASQESRAPLGDLMAQLQQQAATGSGSWEAALKAATDKTKAAASAIGQSQANTGGDYSSSLRNIGNAQAGAEQRAVGQGNVLREQSKNAAQDQLSGLLQTTGAQDTSEAASEAAVKQSRDETNQQILAQARNTGMNVLGGLGSALMSDGGPVPGKAKVPGNDEANDTVPTMLSPGEVVLPRTIAHDPEAAADFVRTLNASKQRGGGGVQHMADGGGIQRLDEAGNQSGLTGARFEDIVTGRKVQAPSIENGGLLNDTNARAGHDNMMALSKLMQQRANGQSATPGQMSTNAADDAIGNALGADRRAGAANVMAGTAAAQQGAGGQAAAAAGNEQAGGQAALAGALTGQRANDLGLARAEQQAAWRNTMMNANVSAENQALLARLIAGAAQGFSSLSSSGSKPSASGGGPFSLGADQGGASSTGGGDDASLIGGAGAGGGFSGAGDNTGGGEPDSDWGDGFAFGGAVGLADGGDVESPEMHRLRLQARKEGHDWAKTDVPVESDEMHTVRMEARRKGMDWAQEKPDTRKRLADFAKKLGETASATAGGMIPRKMAGEDYATRPADQVVPSPGYMTTEDGAVEAPFTFVRAGPGDQKSLPIPAPPGYSNTLGPNLSAPLQMARQQAAEAAKPLPKGIGPDVPPPPPVVPPTPIEAPLPAGVRAPPSHALERGFAANTAQLANQQAGEAADARAAAETSGALAEQKAIETAALAERETRERVRMSTSEAMTRWAAAQEEMSKVDGTVDPGHYWASRTTGQKILGVIGLALGAVGAGADGINRAAVMMNQAIDRDVDAQKAQFEARLKKAGAKVAAAQTFYGMARESGLDEIAATHAAKAAALDSTAAKTKAMLATVRGQEEKARLMALSAALDGAKLDKDAETERWTADFQQKNQQIGIAARVAGAKSNPMALDKTDVDKLQQIDAHTRTLKTSGDKLAALIDAHGTTEWTGPEEAQMRQLTHDMVIDAAKVKDPTSIVSPKEAEGEAANLFAPGLFQTTASAKAAIKSYVDNHLDRRKQHYATYRLNAPEIR